MQKIVQLKILTALFLFCLFNYLPAQDRPAETLHTPGERYSSDESRQHYQQGKEFYSSGRYEEARTEFGKALDSISPPKLVTDTKQEQVPQKALEISPSAKETLQEKEDKKKEEEKEKEKKKKEEKGAGGSKAEVTTSAMTTPDSAAPVVEQTQSRERQYYIDVGDVLDISVWQLPSVIGRSTGIDKSVSLTKGEQEYYISPGDVLDISVWQVPDLSKSEVIVRPDGKISYPLIGDIKAEGLSLTKLDGLITEELKAYVKTPRVSIMIRRFGSTGEEVSKVTMRSDLSRSEVIVRPDGEISLPLVGDLKAESLTLTELNNVITGKLRPYMTNLQVSIMVRHFSEQANKVVVLGEVPAPGVYRFGGPPTIVEVIASAGGYTKYAVLNSIMVFRGDVRAKPEVSRVNFAKIIKSGKLSENIFLKSNDIVYVPRSFIGNVNTFMELIQPAVSEYMQTMDARRFHNIMNRN